MNYTLSLIDSLRRALYNRSSESVHTPYEVHRIDNNSVDRDRFNHAVRTSIKTGKPVMFYSEVYKRELIVSAD